MAKAPFQRKPKAERPKIWAAGGQRPPFEFRAFGRAALFLTREEGTAPALAWGARGLRRAALNVRDGKGRIPAEKLGRAARFVPSHLRVAAWIKNMAATLAHASAVADPDVARGNALVAEIEPHLWGLDAEIAPVQAPVQAPVRDPDPEPLAATEPVVLAEPVEADPLASIRTDLAADTRDNRATGAQADAPPGPPGAVAEGAIQVLGYLAGWGTTILVLPYGALRALWLYAAGRDLRTIGDEAG